MLLRVSIACALAGSAAVLGGPILGKAPAAAPSAARFISLEGAQNFRDIGGYRAQDGRTVKYRLLYRSGTLGGLTAAGQARFDSLGTVAVVDLRTTSERQGDANGVWLKARPGYWSRDYGASYGDLAHAFGDPAKLSAAAMSEMVAQFYRGMIKEQAPSYRVLFARLISARGPVVLNCTAGKDRTGIASALVLTALGVPYPAVREDFLLSNVGIDVAALQKTIGGPLANLPADVVRPLLGVDGANLDAAFDQMRRDYGSVENYLARELGIGPKEIARLRKRMLA